MWAFHNQEVSLFQSSAQMGLSFVVITFETHTGRAINISLTVKIEKNVNEIYAGVIHVKVGSCEGIFGKQRC